VAEPTKFATAGQRLLAALMSYEAGEQGVDRILEQSLDFPINPLWDELAMKLLDEIRRQMVDAANLPSDPAQNGCPRHQ